MTQIDGRTALALGVDIDRGRLDPRDLAESLLDRINREDPDRQIYVRTCDLRARREAAAAFDRARRSMRLSPLDGVPLSWKDLFDTAEVETAGGSALLAHRVPATDAVALARLTAAGTVCLGKTNMTELAFSGLGINPVTGTPPNPFDPRTPRCPGGSSSGAAVSVARELAAAAMGSDTGGSIRLPAAWNGLVGLKPTIDTMPMQGVLPLAQSFDVIGPLTRDAADAAALYHLLNARRVAETVAADLSRCVFWMAGDPVDRSLDPGVEQVYRAAVGRLIRCGARVDARPWTEAGACLDLAGVLVGTEAFANWGAAIDARPDKMSAQLRARFSAGRGITAVQYLTARARLEDIRRRHNARAAGYDAVILPTSALTAPEIAPLTADPDLFAHTNLLALRNPRIANLLGLPAVTVPVGRNSLGLPVGLMLVGRPHDEPRLLSLALAIERQAAA